MRNSRITELAGLPVSKTRTRSVYVTVNVVTPLITTLVANDKPGGSAPLSSENVRLAQQPKSVVEYDWLSVAGARFGFVPVLTVVPAAALMNVLKFLYVTLPSESVMRAN